jgi:hypothetical protein
MPRRDCFDCSSWPGMEWREWHRLRQCMNHRMPRANRKRVSFCKASEVTAVRTGRLRLAAAAWRGASMPQTLRRTNACLKPKLPGASRRTGPQPLGGFCPFRRTGFRPFSSVPRSFLTGPQPFGSIPQPSGRALLSRWGPLRSHWGAFRNRLGALLNRWETFPFIAELSSAIGERSQIIAETGFHTVEAFFHIRRETSGTGWTEGGTGGKAGVGAH